MDRTVNRRVALVAIVVGLSALLLLLVSDGRPPAQHDMWQVYRQQIAPPVPPPVRACWWGNMCSSVVTGTAGGTWVIRGSSGTLGEIQEYHTATFDQWVLSRTDTSVRIKVASKAVVDTQVGFPLRSGQLPADVLPYLQPTSSQQSDDPAIAGQAQALVAGAETEAQAVVAILDWVRANIIYDYTFSLPRDAVSVYHNRSGVCEGFSNLAVALLRASGIPARTQVGCALWALPRGGGHAWIEVFYPDLGWVPSEPQQLENYVDQHLVSPRWWEWCGKATTDITYTERLATQEVYELRTLYADTIWPVLYSASVPTWDRNPVHVTPAQLTYLLSVSESAVARQVEVESSHCYSTTWGLRSDAPWISVSPEQGVTRTQVLVSVDARQLPVGLSISSITVTTPSEWYDTGSTQKVIPVSVWIVDEVRRSYLPLVFRNGGQ